MMRPLPFLAVALSLVACDTLESLDTVEVPVDGRVTVPGSPLGGIRFEDQELPFPGLTTFNFEKSFRDNGFSPSDIGSVRLLSLRLSAIDPVDATLDFLDDVAFYIEADGLERRQIAVLSPIPAGVDSVLLDVVDIELKPYTIAPGMAITTRVSGMPPAHDTSIEARALFDVDADVL